MKQARSKARAYVVLGILRKGFSGNPGIGDDVAEQPMFHQREHATIGPNGNTVTWNVPMTFKPAYAGAKNIYLLAVDASGSNSGWQQLGSWTASSASGTPSAVSVTPSSGSGASQTFALQYSDTSGAAGLQQVWVYFNSTLANPASNACLLYYNAVTNQISLLGDNGTTWQAANQGSATTLQNSQCSINVGTSTITTFGDTLMKVVGQYAPALIASFGSGGSRIEIRAVAAGGAAAYQGPLAGRSAGPQEWLSTAQKPPPQVHPGGRRALGGGGSGFSLAGDPRSAVVPVHAAGDGVQRFLSRRRAAFPRGHCRQRRGRNGAARLAAALAMVNGQETPYLPAHCAIARLGTGQPVLLIEFASPSPLGSPSAVLTADVRRSDVR